MITSIFLPAVVTDNDYRDLVPILRASYPNANIYRHSYDGLVSRTWLTVNGSNYVEKQDATAHVKKLLNRRGYN